MTVGEGTKELNTTEIGEIETIEGPMTKTKANPLVVLYRKSPKLLYKMYVLLSLEIYANDWCRNEEWFNAKSRGSNNYIHVPVNVCSV